MAKKIIIVEPKTAEVPETIEETVIELTAEPEVVLTAEPEVVLPEAPQEFKIVLDEFLSTMPKAQVMKNAFESLCRNEKISGHKTLTEWKRLYQLFKSQPMSKTWTQWVNQGGN